MLRLACAATMLFLAACGGGEDPGPISRLSAAEDYAFIACGYNVGCDPGVTPETYQVNFDACVDVTIAEVCSVGNCEDLVPDPRATLASIDCVLGWYEIECGMPTEECLVVI